MCRRTSKRNSNSNTKKQILYFCKDKKINKNDKNKITKISELLKTPIENLQDGQYIIKSTLSKFKYQPVVYIKKPSGPLLRFNLEIRKSPDSMKIEIGKLREKEHNKHRENNIPKNYLKFLKQSRRYISSVQRSEITLN